MIESTELNWLLFETYLHIMSFTGSYTFTRADVIPTSLIVVSSVGKASAQGKWMVILPNGKSNLYITLSIDVAGPIHVEIKRWLIHTNMVGFRAWKLHSIFLSCVPFPLFHPFWHTVWVHVRHCEWAKCHRQWPANVGHNRLIDIISCLSSRICLPQMESVCFDYPSGESAHMRK